MILYNGFNYEYSVGYRSTEFAKMVSALQGFGISKLEFMLAGYSSRQTAASRRGWGSLTPNITIVRVNT